MSISILPVVGECIIKGLQDDDDDVRAIAARALLPVADHLHTSFNDKVRRTKKGTGLFAIFISSW